jgi:hypothetical protein
MFELFLFAITSGIIGGIVASYIIKRELIGSEDEINEQVHEIMNKMKQTVVPCKLEFVNNTILMYNRETNEFIAQGNTFEELETRLKKEFPDKYFDVKQEDIDYAKTLGKQNG